MKEKARDNVEEKIAHNFCLVSISCPLGNIIIFYQITFTNNYILCILIIFTFAASFPWATHLFTQYKRQKKEKLIFENIYYSSWRTLLSFILLIANFTND